MSISSKRRHKSSKKHPPNHKEDPDLNYYSSDDEQDTILNKILGTDSPSNVIGNKTFEFTDTLDVMRFLRMLLFFQTLSIVLDYPSYQLPFIFHNLVRPVLFYLIRFYSRPFLDLVYVIQLFFEMLLRYFSTAQIFFGKQIQNHIPSRKLWESDPRPLSIEINFLSSQDWHTIQHYSHFILGILFSTLAVIFTLRFWCISDLTDLSESIHWMNTYIANGMWRRGGLLILFRLIYSFFFITLLFYLLFAISRQFGTPGLTPFATYIGAFVAVMISVLFLLGIFTHRLLLLTREAFTRYVSQNVAYTSSIILKRVLKVKIELGLGLMISLYTPVLYTLCKALVLANDWNTTLAKPHRKSRNHYVPCYSLAFPPYKEQSRPISTCPVHTHKSPFVPLSGDLYFKEHSILPCDSLLGVGVHCVALIATVFLVLGYGWLFYSIAHNVSSELKASTWAESCNSLCTKRNEEIEKYEEQYPPLQRIQIYVRSSLRAHHIQLKELAGLTKFAAESFSRSVVTCFYLPVKLFFSVVSILEEGIEIFLSLFFYSLSRDSREVDARNPNKSDSRGVYSSLPSSEDESSLSKPDSGQVLGSTQQTQAALAAASFRKKQLMIGKNKSRILSRSASQTMVQADGFFVHFIVKPFVRTFGFLAHLSFVDRCKQEIALKIVSFRQFRLQVQARIYSSEFAIDSAIKFKSWRAKYFPSETKQFRGIGLSDLWRSEVAEWRSALTQWSKYRSIRDVDRKLVKEQRFTREEFTRDHTLSITAFDSTMNTSGMLLLIAPYHWDHQLWILVIWIELSLQAILGAISYYYFPWDDRVYLHVSLTLIFALVYYFASPFTEEIDKYLELFGRFVVIFCALGCRAWSLGGLSTQPGVIRSIYRPISSLLGLLSNYQALTRYTVLDLTLVSAFFGYMLLLFQIVGIFRYLALMWRSLVYVMHDHVMDFIVAKCSERIVGFENLSSGLRVVQQWDDVIATQRRYFLLPWPEIKPAELLSVREKILEIKWAAMFNLHVSNIRSSLGLSLLHVFMCSADVEILRWIIHNHPHLLAVEDFQRDTPVSLALKECAFWLLLYGKQNQGLLDDGTSFSDEDFNEYYPEMGQLLFAAEKFGEFDSSSACVYKLDARESIQLKSEGRFVETKNSEFKHYVPSFKRQEKAKMNFLIEKDIGANVVREVKAEQQAEKKRQLRALAGASKKEKERLSLIAHRFPEDTVVEDFECGLVTPWRVIGLEVPQENLFLGKKFINDAGKNFGSDDEWEDSDDEKDDEIDQLIERGEELPQIEEGDEDSEEDSFVTETPSQLEQPSSVSFSQGLIEGSNLVSVSHPSGTNEDQLAVISPSKLAAQSDSLALSLVQSSVTLNQPYNRDLRSVIPTHLAVVNPHPEEAQLLTRAVANEEYEMKDWDEKQFDVQNNFSKKNQKLSVSQVAKLVRIGNITINYNQDHHSETEIRFKMCKFAELFTSKEVFSNRHLLKWNSEVFKYFNKLADPEQGRLAQHVAMAVNLDPPEGFTRISEWTLGISDSTFEEPEQVRGLDAISQGAVSMVKGVSDAANKISSKIVPKSFTVSKKNKRYTHGAALGTTSDASAMRRTGTYSDRIISYLAECYVCCRTSLNLADMELSVYARSGFRALVRALRRKFSMFVIPGMYTSPKEINLLHLDLRRNELDDGDAILIAEIFLYQLNLQTANLSFNRLGSRGAIRILRVLKLHESIRSLNLDHNRIGPLIGKDLGVFLKKSHTLKVFSMGNNRIGSLVRYPNLYQRETMDSAARDIFSGLKYNKSLQLLDLSYNHMGPSLADFVPRSVIRHPTLMSLNLSGSDLGNQKGSALIFNLSGVAWNLRDQEQAALAAMKKMHKDGELDASELMGEEESEEGSTQTSKKSAQLCELNLADNQLGTMAGRALAVFIRSNYHLTALNASNNSLGVAGGQAIADVIDRCYCENSEDELTQLLNKLQATRYMGHGGRKKPKLKTSIISLNLSNNGLGPSFAGKIMKCLGNPVCTLTDLDISNNPLGYTIAKAGDAFQASKAFRHGIGKNKTLVRLNIGDSSFTPATLVSILGGMSANKVLTQLILKGLPFDEPSCLQCSYVVEQCSSIKTLDLSGCSMGPRGSMMLTSRVKNACDHLVHLNLSKNSLGALASQPIGEALKSPGCTISTLNLAGNSLEVDGFDFILEGLRANGSVTSLDVSDNKLGPQEAEKFGIAIKGSLSDGKHSMNRIRKLNISDNPGIGTKGARYLIKSLSAAQFHHLELAHIGAGPATASLIAKSVRNVSLTWKFIDVSHNDFGREGLNSIFWAMRQNRRIRVLRCSDCKAGPLLGTQQDTLGKSHGIAIRRMLLENVVLRELDLSFNGLSSAAGNNILEAMVENYVISRLSLRGNHLNDDVKLTLEEFFKCNNVLQELDLGENKLGFNCAYSVTEGLLSNRSLRSLLLDNNQLGNAGTIVADSFSRALMMNHTLRTLSLQTNRLGPEWGVHLAQALSRNNTLVNVDLRDNHLDPESGLALVHSYQHAPHLHELALSFDEVGKVVWETFTETYNLKKAIVRLDKIEEDIFSTQNEEKFETSMISFYS